DEVPDGALHDAAADLEVGAPEPLVLHPRRVLDKVVAYLAEHLAAVLVAGPGHGCTVESPFDLGDNLVELTPPEPLLLRCAPDLERCTLAARPGTDRLTGGPELLHDVVPVEADLGAGEELLLQRPDGVGAIGHEEHLGELRGPVSSLLRLQG